MWTLTACEKEASASTEKVWTAIDETPVAGCAPLFWVCFR